ncbi:MAG TPA: dihydrofolate reductase family protein [Bryobacteraceae bacterium]|nr:dihydrofolate reductase family protein [Terriglobales bacterium]HUI78706.1 dihydrofolate reductase family protein [Bryobacteraceae bacterium]
MRKVTYGGASSLDNYLARKDDAVDWLLWSKELASVMSDYWKTIDTILMGRRTYEVSLRHGGGAAPDPHITTYVFSRTLRTLSDSNVNLVSSDAAEFVRRLKQPQGKDICLMGGGELAKSMFEADLIDEVGFNIHPVLLGSGIPALPPMSRQINLELVNSRVFQNGCVLVTYRVRHGQRMPRPAASHSGTRFFETTSPPRLFVVTSRGNSLWNVSSQRAITRKHK